MKRKPFDLNAYQSFVGEFHAESDRSAIVLAGSFAEHFLASYLRHYMIEDEGIERLFETGALQSFDARINLSYALRLISKSHRDDLRVIKDIRNRFAHSPKLMTLKRDDIRQEIYKLSMWPIVLGEPPNPSENQERHAYLLSIGMFVLFAHTQMQAPKGNLLSHDPISMVVKSETKIPLGP